jgi:hypothetical protein
MSQTSIIARTARFAGVATLLAAVFATGSICAAEAEQKKTFGEWVEVYRVEHEAALKNHPDLDYVGRGAALYCSLGKYGWGLYSEDRTKHDLKKLTKVGREYYDAFAAFMDSEKGKAMFANYRKEGSLNPEDQAYYWVVQATEGRYPPRGVTDRRVSDLRARACITMVKAYKRQGITRAEMDAFRELTAINTKGGTVATWNLRFPQKRAFGRYLKASKLMAGPVSVGEKVPDLKLSYFETLAEDESYRHDVYEYSLHAYITPRLMELISRTLLAFKYEVREGKETLTADYSAYERMHKGRYFSLHTEFKKGRPLFIFKHNVSDTFDYARDVGHMEALYWLFKEEVAFYHLTDLRSGVGVAEYFARGDVFAGMWKQRALVGGSAENHFGLDGADLSLIPKAQLRLPTSSVPMLIDLGAATSYTNGYSNFRYFIDKNGVQCKLRYWNRNYAGYGARKQWRDKIPQMSYTDAWPIDLLRHIHLFKVMETLNWQYDPESDLLKSHHAYVKDATYQEFARLEIGKGTLLKLDIEKGEMLVRGTVAAMAEKVEKDHLIRFGKRPRVLTRSGDAVRIGGTLADMKKGDTVSLCYRLKLGTPDHKILRSISKGAVRQTASANDALLLSGKITTIDLDKAECTVVMPKPDVKRGEWKGFRIYEEELKKLGLPEPDEKGSPGWAACKKMYYGDESARTFILKIDDAVEFSVNGRLSTLDKAAVGDRVVFGIMKKGYEYRHPHYVPYNVLVVKDGPLKGDELLYDGPSEP